MDLRAQKIAKKKKERKEKAKKYHARAFYKLSWMHKFVKYVKAGMSPKEAYEFLGRPPVHVRAHAGIYRILQYAYSQPVKPTDSDAPQIQQVSPINTVDDTGGTESSQVEAAHG